MAYVYSANDGDALISGLDISQRYPTRSDFLIRPSIAPLPPLHLLSAFFSPSHPAVLYKFAPYTNLFGYSPKVHAIRPTHLTAYKKSPMIGPYGIRPFGPLRGWILRPPIPYGEGAKKSISYPPRISGLYELISQLTF